MRLYPLALAGCLSLALASTAQAAGGAGANPFFGSLYQAAAAAIVFLTLFFILKAKAWGPILQGLQDREKKISDDLASAERSAQQAQDTLRQYQSKLAEAQEESRRLIEQARAEAQTLAAQLREQTHAEIDALRARAQADVAAAKDQAVAEMYALAGELATSVAGRILRREVRASDHQALIDDSLREMGRSLRN